jgi:CBS domain-containing protein
MAIVRQILKQKGNQIFSVQPQDTVLDALNLLAEKQIGAVLVMEEDELKGIFSERDYARWGRLQKNPLQTPVSELMTRVVYYVTPDNTVEECMIQMTDKRIRHLPVIENGKVAGVISIGDVVKMIIEDKDDHIHGLESYILGRRT